MADYPPSEGWTVALILNSGTQVYTLSAAEAAGVWCSDWDLPAILDFEGLFADGYTGTFITSDPYFTEVASPYPGIDGAAQILGCTPGLAAP